MSRDLTQHRPIRVLFRLCLPIFFSVMFQQLYIVTDSLVAGRYISEAALAAIGNTYQVTLIYQAIAFGCTMGCSVVVSRLFGAKRFVALQSAVFTALISALALCIVLTATGILGGTTMLHVMKTPENAFQGSIQYLNIYSAGLIFLFFYQITLGIFTALGDSRTPFIFLTGSSILNILLDFWFVAHLNWGVVGIAWATLICQAAGGLVSLLILLNKLKKLLKADGSEEDESIFSLPLFKEMAHIAVPLALQQIVISIGNILIQANVNSYGSSVAAGYGAAIKLNNMAIAALMAFDKGMSSFAAQNMGAKKPERIITGRRAAIALSFSFGLVLAILFLLFRADLLQLFLKTKSGEAFDSGIAFFLLVIPFYLVASVKIACDGVLRGLGAVRPLLTSTFIDLALRVGTGYLFSALWGSIGIWAAWPIGWTVGMTLSAIFSRRLLRASCH